MYVYVAGSALLLTASVIPSLREKTVWAFDIVAVLLFGQRRIGLWLILVIMSGCFFWFLRPSAFFTGDSYAAVTNVSNDLPIIYKWTETGAIWVAGMVASIIPAEGIAKGDLAYNSIAVVSGMVTIAFFGLISRYLSDSPSSRLAAFLLMLTGGWIILFFGYTENYPILWPFATATIYFGLRYLEGHRMLITMLLCWVIGVVLHLQMLFFLPAITMVIAERYMINATSGRRKTIIGIVSIATIAVFGAGIWLSFTRPRLREYMLPLFTGRPPDWDYTLLSLPHLGDIVNLLFYVLPLWPVLFLLGDKRPAVTSQRRFFLWLSLGGFMFLLLIDPKLGMARDWDLFALTILGPALLLITMFLSRIQAHTVLPILIFAAVLLVMPSVATLLTVRSSVDQFKHYLALDLPRARTGMILLRDWYAAIGNEATADSLTTVLAASFPAYTKVPEAIALMNHGKLDQALALVDSLMATEVPSVELHDLRARILLRMSQPVRALDDINESIARGHYDGRVFITQAKAYYQLKRFDDMLASLREAEKRDPGLFFIPLGRGIAYLNTRWFDSSLYHIRRAIEMDSTSEISYKIAGYALFYGGNPEGAELYLRKYLALSTVEGDRPEVEEILRHIHEQLDELKKQ